MSLGGKKTSGVAKAYTPGLHGKGVRRLEPRKRRKRQRVSLLCEENGKYLMKEGSNLQKKRGTKTKEPGRLRK